MSVSQDLYILRKRQRIWGKKVPLTKILKKNAPFATPCQNSTQLDKL